MKLKHIRRFNESQMIKVKNENIEMIVECEIVRLGIRCDLNHIDVSEVTDMYGLFQYIRNKVDISQWNVKNVTHMEAMFRWYPFTIDISNWNVENVVSMDAMFAESNFNGDISNWNIKSLELMAYMFERSKFSGDLDKWMPYKVNYIYNSFNNCPIEKTPPIWYQTLLLGLFGSGKEYCLSLEYNWIEHKKINRRVLEEVVKTTGGDIKNIDKIRGYRITNFRNELYD